MIRSRGSVLALSVQALSLASGNTGLFQYTGQVWISQLGLYYYKARFYSPWLGRFMQTDPVGYEGGVNLYAYAGGDPINFADPTGNTDIYIGGFADIFFQPVYSYYLAQKLAHPERQIIYFQYSETEKIMNAATWASLRNEPVNLIAHSWGTRTALNVAHTSNVRIDNLITVDPVSWSGDFSRPANVIHWLNIVATGFLHDKNLSDDVATVGGKRGKLAGADENNPVDVSHADFGPMMDRGGGARRRESAYEEWSIDAGQITGSRASGSRVNCNQNETNVC